MFVIATMAVPVQLGVVPLFILMGVILEKSRVAEELLTTMAKLFGGLRGGLRRLRVGMLQDHVGAQQRLAAHRRADLQQRQDRNAKGDPRPLIAPS